MLRPPNPERIAKREAYAELAVTKRAELLTRMNQEDRGANFREAFKLVYLDVRIMWAGRNRGKTDNETEELFIDQIEPEVAKVPAQFSEAERLTKDTLRLHRRLALDGTDAATANFFKSQDPVAASYLHVIDEVLEDHPEISASDLEALASYKIGTYLSNPPLHE